MAIAYVRDTGKIVSDNVSSSPGSFASLPAVNNHVFALVANYQASNPAVTLSDNQLNSWAVDVSQFEATPLGSNIASAKVATSAGIFTITVTPSAAGAYMSWVGVEFSGLDRTDWLDQIGNDLGTTGANAANVTADGANSQADMLVLACMGPHNLSGDLAIGTPTVGYTELFVEQDGSAHMNGEGAYKIVSASETSSAAWTHDAEQDTWTAVIATYKGLPPIGYLLNYHR